MVESFVTVPQTELAQRKLAVQIDPTGSLRMHDPL
jgi:hypothetical protein